MARIARAQYCDLTDEKRNEELKSYQEVRDSMVGLMHGYLSIPDLPIMARHLRCMDGFLQEALDLEIIKAIPEAVKYRLVELKRWTISQQTKISQQSETSP